MSKEKEEAIEHIVVAGKNIEKGLNYLRHLTEIEKQPSPTEFSKKMRDWIEKFDYCHSACSATGHLAINLLQSCDIIDQQAAEIEQLQAENKRLKEDLLKYGLHLDNCPCYVPDGERSVNAHHTKTMDELNIKKKNGFITTVKCTCGFEQALKGENNEKLD